jgi:DNA polymerase-1
MGAYSLAKTLKISNKEAKEFIELFFEKFKSIKEYLEDTENKIKYKKQVTTLFNRHRYFYDFDLLNKMEKNHQIRAGINHTIQGTAADIIKKAMIDLYNIKKEQNLNFKILLQVHDELVIETDKKNREKIAKILKDSMENAVSLCVKTDVEVKWGDNLKDMQKVDIL